ncbi:hypothetical protein RchiOBHm_Chr6g0251731 [Rosa chinensis]|uniref:Uncharacterized protein n=1 Tax=Rosa chinensis TaxID=74649 RepID=A0A2P6PKV8_ROSCH|nr:putative UPF0481 protein At3g02645 [Rosa chinensis]PRQ22567.1 hypothetical protein RchiOBHm_Chr6g0251731 [Rosa chinensis]
MSSLQPTFSSNSSSNFNELQWVIQIQKFLEEEFEHDIEIPISIFNVPKSLMASDPESYTPQVVAIGPYHHWRPELYEMVRYKVAAAKRTQKQLQTLKFQDLVDQLTRFELRIRACYHKYLEFNGETLGWMMAIDASFFFEILQVYVVQEGNTSTRVSSRMAHLVDYAGRKSAHHAILRDLVMLENQMPLFVLREVLAFQLPTLECTDNMLLSMFMGLCKELSPFKMNDEDMPKIQVSSCCHLLDFLYRMITPKLETRPSEITETEDGPATPHKGKSSDNSNFLKQFLEKVGKLLSKLNKGPIRLLKKILISRPVKVLHKLPWTILSNHAGPAILKQPLELLSSQDKEAVKPEDDKSSNRPPLIEEITIPSVSKLSKSGVKFLPASSISTISFDAKTCSFYLPSTSLDGNTEVILRNLVAYEASTASGPLVFTRYTELMNGIIDTEEDAKLLREKGIIVNRLKSDEEVAKLFNGMSRSIRLTKVPFLDKAIKDANKYYHGRWKVKMRKSLKTYVFGSWQFLASLATIFLLLLMTLEAFCSVYSCSRMFHINTTNK